MSRLRWSIGDSLLDHELAGELVDTSYDGSDLYHSYDVTVRGAYPAEFSVSFPNVLVSTSRIEQLTLELESWLARPMPEWLDTPFATVAELAKQGSQSLRLAFSSVSEPQLITGGGESVLKSSCRIGTLLVECAFVVNPTDLALLRDGFRGVLAETSR